MKGDFTRDGEINLSDFVLFAGCMSGPENGPVSAPCATGDFNDDTDVDSADFAEFQAAIRP